MEKLRFVDTFAGIGGFHIGIEQTLGKDNVECVAFIEIDKDAREVYNKNFNQDKKIKEFKDITKVDAKDIPDHEILCGGFPCQAFSINKQNSKKSKIDSDDERTYLYKDLARIAEEKKPKYLFFENVANLARIIKGKGVKMTGKGSFGFEFGDILMLDDIKETFSKIGYNLDCKVYDAADFGVPQQRKRVYIIGKRRDLKEDIVWPEPEYESVNLRSILEEEVDESLTVTFKDKTCTSRCFHKDDEQENWMNSERYYCNKASKDDTVYKWVQDGTKNKYNLEPTGLDKSDMVWQNKKQAFDESISVKNNKKGDKCVITPKSIVMYDTPSGLSRQHERIYSIEGISRTLATFGHPMYDVDGTIRKLSSRESARCQGFPDSFEVHKNYGKACKQFGNAVCVNVIESITKENFR